MLCLNKIKSFENLLSITKHLMKEIPDPVPNLQRYENKGILTSLMSTIIHDRLGNEKNIMRNAAIESKSESESEGSDKNNEESSMINKINNNFNKHNVEWHDETKTDMNSDDNDNDVNSIDNMKIELMLQKHLDIEADECVTQSNKSNKNNGTNASSTSINNEDKTKLLDNDDDLSPSSNHSNDDNNKLTSTSSINSIEEIVLNELCTSSHEEIRFECHQSHVRFQGSKRRVMHLKTNQCVYFNESTCLYRNIKHFHDNSISGSVPTRIKVKTLSLIAKVDSKDINAALSKYHFIVSHYIILYINDKAPDEAPSMQNCQNDFGLLALTINQLMKKSYQLDHFISKDAIFSHNFTENNEKCHFNMLLQMFLQYNSRLFRKTQGKMKWVYFMPIITSSPVMLLHSKSKSIKDEHDKAREIRFINISTSTKHRKTNEHNKVLSNIHMLLLIHNVLFSNRHVSR